MSDSGLDADVIVVGLGAMGAAVAFHAAQRGMSVLGIDRFDPPHEFGSTTAETRITRLAVAEGPQYLPFVARSHELWRELEDLTGEKVLHETGGFIITEPTSSGNRWRDFADATADIARIGGIDVSSRTPAQVRAEHPALNVPDDNTVVFEPTAGLVMNERAVALQLEQARRLGAKVRTRETVLSVEPESGGIVVRTDVGTYRADDVVLATGPWMSELAPVFDDRLTVTRQVAFWFEADDLDVFRTDRLPLVMWVGEKIDKYIAVFPTPPNGTAAVKVLGEQFHTATTAQNVDRTVTESEIRDFYEQLVVPKVAGLRPNCVRSTVCLYTNTADDHFLIDTDPRSDHILVMSPCSGHGFKHSAALGEAVAERLATGTSTLDLSPFAV